MESFILPETTVLPLPLGVILISIFASPPVADKVGPLVVAALATVNSLTALPVSENFNNSKVPSPIAFPLTSNCPPNCGVVSSTTFDKLPEPSTPL